MIQHQAPWYLPKQAESMSTQKSAHEYLEQLFIIVKTWKQ